MTVKAKDQGSIGARRAKGRMRDSAEEMAAIWNEDSGEIRNAAASRRKRKKSYRKIMELLSPEERAEADEFMKRYVEHLQVRHEWAADRRRKP